MRQLEVKRVMDTVPEWAERVGFVGAAVSEWEGIREAMKAVVDSGRGIGISSLRADRMDQEFVDLLYRGGARTMTIASDAPSQRQRNKMAKGIRTEHLWNSATLARDAGMLKIKLYVIIGLPTEDDADIAELIAFCKDLSGILPTALGVSPLVPKLHTPLGDAPFAGLDVIDAKLTAIRKGLDGMAEIRSTSAKWAWVEYRMSQGDAMAGQAALAAWREGGDFRAWERAFVGRPERPALEVANRHGLFRAAGMK